MKKIRVLEIVTTRFAANGISQYVLTHLDGLGGDIVCDVVAINEPDKELAARVTARGGNLFVLPMRNKSPLAYIRKLKKIIRLGKYDIVHAHGNSSTLLTEMIAAKSAGVPVRIPHAHNTRCKQKALHVLLRPFFNAAYTDGAACGRAAGRFLFPRNGFTVLKNGIDTERFRFDPAERARLREELHAEDKRILLHVGSFNEQKNQTFLIKPFRDALEKDPQLLLLLAGNGERQSAVRAEAERLGVKDKVVFLGRRDDIESLLSCADVFVMPSLFEGFPISLVEAQCAGLPCLVSDAVTHDAAILQTVRFLEPDPKVWTRAILNSRLLEYDRTTACEIVRGAGYDREETAGELGAFYRKLAGGEEA
ncbi:MAG: glycosyltransferase [Clostridia bacterium]|nr:glycosyltransferase [Clostridia bacterium]